MIQITSVRPKVILKHNSISDRARARRIGDGKMDGERAIWRELEILIENLIHWKKWEYTYIVYIYI